jgi:hypothetical protein
MTAAVVDLLVLAAQETPEPEDVKAGWLGLFVFLALAAAVVFLWFSLRKQLGRVTFEEKGAPGDPGDTADTADTGDSGDASTEDSRPQPHNGTTPGAPRGPQA